MEIRTRMRAPTGILTIVSNGEKLTNIMFEQTQLEVISLEMIKDKSTYLLHQNVERQLLEYFQGVRKTFELPLLISGTEFQKKVWEALETIPYGETRSYKEIAIQIGNPKACRAVGMANNRNKIPIIIPCHRVIGSNGKMIGYAGGEPIKKQLLDLEKK